MIIVKGSYENVEKIFLFACIVYVAYIVSGFLVEPNWKQAAIDSVRPHLQFDAGYISMLIGYLRADHADASFTEANRQALTDAGCEQIVEEHPRLSRQSVLAALEFGAQALRADVVYPLVPQPT